MTDDREVHGDQAPSQLKPPASGPFLTCDGRAFKRIMQAALVWLERHHPAINALNVYPVPDGDTGTNMLLTMQAAFGEIQDSPEEHVGAVSQKLAHGALMGARGNSGVILSQIFRGFARSIDGSSTFNTVQFAAAMREAAATAYKGVIKPVEGTILTVARESADAAVGAAAASEDLAYVLERVTAEARASVARTPSLLPVLAEAGVVDAGGQGLFVLLEGMVRYLKGEPLDMDRAMNAAVDLHAPHPERAEGYGYDIQFVIHGDNLNVDEIRHTIGAMGDSALVVGDSRAVKVHVHSPEPGTPINYGASVGSLSRVIVENMQEQYQEFILSQARRPPPAADPANKIGVVVVASGEGLTRVFESLGANAVVPGGQTMNPSTEDVLRAVESLPHDQVIVLPNNKNIIMTAEQAQSLSSKQVQVVRTISIPQGIAALLALNYQADLAANVRVMADAATSIQTAEITTAVRSAQINGVSVQEGQVIGILNGTLKVRGDTPAEVVLSALREMEAGHHEIITLYYGEAVTPDEAEKMGTEIGIRYPGQEVEVIDGGQLHYYYILSVE